MSEKLQELESEYNRLKENFKSVYASYTTQLANLKELIKKEKEAKTSPEKDGWTSLDKRVLKVKERHTPKSDGWADLDKVIKTPIFVQPLAVTRCWSCTRPLMLGEVCYCSIPGRVNYKVWNGCSCGRTACRCNYQL
jgi:hypothetical protein